VRRAARFPSAGHRLGQATFGTPFAQQLRLHGLVDGLAPKTTVDQRLAKRDSGWVVDLQDRNGCSADASQPDKDRAVVTKVPSPFVSARVK